MRSVFFTVLAALSLLAVPAWAQPHGPAEPFAFLVEVETPPDGAAAPNEQLCDITFRAYHGGSNGRISLSFTRGEVRTRALFWRYIYRQFLLGRSDIQGCSR